MKEGKNVLEAANRLKSQYQSQLELSLNLCNSWFECCERLTEINGQSARRLLAQAEIDGQSWLRGDGTGFMVASGQVAMDQLNSLIACGVEFQRQILAGLAKK